jgi:hypothetical protein
MARWLTMLSMSKQPRSKLGLQVVPATAEYIMERADVLDLQAPLGGARIIVLFPGVR